MGRGKKIREKLSTHLALAVPKTLRYQASQAR